MRTTLFELVFTTILKLACGIIGTVFIFQNLGSAELINAVFAVVFLLLFWAFAILSTYERHQSYSNPYWR